MQHRTGVSSVELLCETTIYTGIEQVINIQQMYTVCRSLKDATVYSVLSRTANDKQHVIRNTSTNTDSLASGRGLYYRTCHHSLEHKSNGTCFGVKEDTKQSSSRLIESSADIKKLFETS